VLESTEEMRIWKWYKKSIKIIGAFREGLIYGTKELQERYNKSHRREGSRYSCYTGGKYLSWIILRWARSCGIIPKQKNFQKLFPKNVRWYQF